jgi:release factor glutamine methyltransferase
MALKGILKSIIAPLKLKFQKWKHLKSQVFAYKDLEVNILPGVFSPLMYSSTKAFLDFIDVLDLDQKTVLELGCGSGIISMLAADKGALVTASDINPIALDELTVHSRDENKNIIVVYSDLFENLHFHFDYILINPPFQNKKPLSVEDKSVCAGQNFEYFECLFSQLKVRTLRETEVLLILPEEVEIFSICRRAKLNHLKLKTVKILTKGLDKFVVYRVVEGD